MEPLTVAFATALVAAMATDTWQEARSAVVALWQRVRPSRQDDSVEEDLDALRVRVLSAGQESRPEIERALMSVWQGRIEELLLDHPEHAVQLRRVLDQTLTPMLAPAECKRVGQIIMTGTSHDASTFSQVAGNQINIRP